MNYIEPAKCFYKTNSSGGRYKYCLSNNRDYDKYNRLQVKQNNNKVGRLDTPKIDSQMVSNLMGEIKSNIGKRTKIKKEKEESTAMEEQLEKSTKQIKEKEKQAVKKPVVKKPAVKKPAVKKPAVKKPAVKKPTEERELVTDNPKLEKEYNELIETKLEKFKMKDLKKLKDNVEIVRFRKEFDNFEKNITDVYFKLFKIPEGIRGYKETKQWRTSNKKLYDAYQKQKKDSLNYLINHFRNIKGGQKLYKDIYASLPGEDLDRVF